MFTYKELNVSFLHEPRPEGKEIERVLKIMNLPQDQWKDIEKDFSEGYVLISLLGQKKIIKGVELSRVKKKGLESLSELLKKKGVNLESIIKAEEAQILLVTSNSEYFLELPWENLKIEKQFYFKDGERLIIRNLLKNDRLNKMSKYSIVFLASFAHKDPYLSSWKSGNISKDLIDELNGLIRNESGVITDNLFDLSEDNTKISGYYLITHGNRKVFLESNLKNFNVFHFIGHGDVRRGLALESTHETLPVGYENSSINPISVKDWISDEIVNKIIENSPFKLIAFSCCDSARPLGSSKSLLMKCLLEGRIDYGIGFRKGISSKMLPSFWKDFYEFFLSKGRECHFSLITDKDKIIESYLLARRKIVESDDYWASPVIYCVDEYEL